MAWNNSKRSGGRGKYGAFKETSRRISKGHRESKWPKNAAGGEKGGSVENSRSAERSNPAENGCVGSGGVMDNNCASAGGAATESACSEGHYPNKYRDGPHGGWERYGNRYERGRMNNYSRKWASSYPGEAENGNRNHSGPPNYHGRSGDWSAHNNLRAHGPNHYQQQQSQQYKPFSDHQVPFRNNCGDQFTQKMEQSNKLGCQSPGSLMAAPQGKRNKAALLASDHPSSCHAANSDGYSTTAIADNDAAQETETKAMIGESNDNPTHSLGKINFAPIKGKVLDKQDQMAELRSARITTPSTPSSSQGTESNTNLETMATEILFTNDNDLQQSSSSTSRQEMDREKEIITSKEADEVMAKSRKARKRKKKNKTEQQSSSKINEEDDVIHVGNVENKISLLDDSAQENVSLNSGETEVKSCVLCDKEVSSMYYLKNN